jgi:hypothetical protein
LRFFLEMTKVIYDQGYVGEITEGGQRRVVERPQIGKVLSENVVVWFDRGKTAIVVIWQSPAAYSGDRRWRFVLGVAHKIYDLWSRRHGPGAGDGGKKQVDVVLVMRSKMLVVEDKQADVTEGLPHATLRPIRSNTVRE